MSLWDINSLKKNHTNVTIFQQNGENNVSMQASRGLSVEVFCTCALTELLQLSVTFPYIPNI